jgi:hypothetical protein
MPTTEYCSYCGGAKTDCPKCNRTVHVDELQNGGCTFCDPTLCPQCHTRALPVSGCLCGLSLHLLLPEPPRKEINAPIALLVPEPPIGIALPPLEPLPAPLVPPNWVGVATATR